MVGEAALSGLYSVPEGKMSPAAPLAFPMTVLASSAAPRSEPLALIVVEDAEDDYEMVVSRLARSYPNTAAVRVETRGELERALEREGWSAVISDHRLPVFSSREALDIVRNRSPDLPFIIVSGAIGEEHAVEAMQAGADDYVMKDNLVRLPTALSRALERARLRRQRREAEKALVESESRFRALAANLPGMVFQAERIEDQLSFVYANDGGYRLFGVSPVTLEAEPGQWLAQLHLDDAARLRRCFMQEGDASSQAQDCNWFDIVLRTRPDAHGDVRSLQFTARARRLSADRTLWDGIAIDITDQQRAGAALRESQRELRELATHMERVREDERAAIAREIHDEIGSALSGLRFQLAWLKTKLVGQATLAEALRHTEEIIDSAIAASNRIMHGLRPPILDQGIVAALEWLARTLEQRSGVRCRFASIPDEIDLPPAPAIVVFRICQEALNNVVKHAGAHHVGIDLCAADHELVLEVADDGRGIDSSADIGKPGHFGLKGMQERAHALGGQVKVAAGGLGGTVVTLRVPLPKGALGDNGSGA